MKDFNYKELIMTDEEVIKTAEEQMEYLGSNAIAQMVLHICKESEKEEPGKFKSADVMTKLLFTAHESYKRGFAEAIYLCNESLKMTFEESA